ncbi:hypothetical protein [Octadecabacter antarcticus]|uniref:hypothetical protein n=1 Tax=Octadecabacter antarcticus TaxID=1217908 RepID=UPI0005C4C6BB|nr:hypothetical protein [Octadecabacter antarcticus]
MIQFELVQKRPNVAKTIDCKGVTSHHLDMDQKTITATTHAVRVNLTIGARRGRAARGRPAAL